MDGQDPKKKGLTFWMALVFILGGVVLTNVVIFLF